MSNITAADVKKLRDKTGLGLADCKRALVECGGDFEAAADFVRKEFGAKMDTRSDRDASEGKIAIAKSDCGKKAVIVLIKAETDFTANNEQFIEMTQAIANMALTQNTGEVEKTDEMEELIKDVRLKTGENVQFGAGKVFEADKVGAYLHFTGKVGALVAFNGEASEELATNVSMHVTAANPAPLGLTRDDVPTDVIEKERQVVIEEVKATGKPQEIAEKIAEGKMRKFFESTSLLEQSFILDDKKAIKDILAGSTIQEYVKLQIG